MSTTPPDPAGAGSLDDLVEALRQLKIWAGDPSYETIKTRVNAAWTEAGWPAAELTRKSTVADCFRTGRRRLNADLIAAVVQTLHPDPGYVGQWRQALRVVIGESAAAGQVRVRSSLPDESSAFTGRTGELDRLRRALRRGDAVVISAIEGMAGVGKTQLAVHAGHLLHREEPFERVLFVNLRGFHPDPAQPPADSAAVLDGFLRLLGVPGQQIPHDLAGRAELYREQLAGIRALVVLDNAATADQVRPLLPATPGCLALVTSRRRLAGLPAAAHLAVDVFTPDEAVAFLAEELPQVEVGASPEAGDRIARRCGYLPLALSLVTGHIRNTVGWTLTDHADRLDESHRDRQLDTGIGLALDLSFRHLPAGHRRLLRLCALHPGQDFDPYAAAALADAGLAEARTLLRDLRADHLLQEPAPGRYTFHDLVHGYAADQAHDEDRPAVRRTALTRLFDHYLTTAGAAMDALYPAESHQRPAYAPAATPAPGLADPDRAREWLDTERHNLVAVAVHTAAQGWPEHTTRLARTLFRYLAGGHHTDAETVHGHAHEAALVGGDLAGQGHALTDLGVTHLQLSRHDRADELLLRARALFRQAGDRAGEGRVLSNLGFVAERAGRYAQAAGYGREALELHRATGDPIAVARSLVSLGVIAQRTNDWATAIDYAGQALPLYESNGDLYGVANVLTSMGEAQLNSGQYETAAEHLNQAVELNLRLGNRTGVADGLDSLGQLHTRLGRFAEATGYYERALVIYREDEDQDGELWALNGLGEAARAAGRPGAALTHHRAALTIAAGIGNPGQEARALAGLGHATRDLGDAEAASSFFERARSVCRDHGIPDAVLDARY
ncbi:tetratricopeptide repeat protein [Paractinoplanes lichenicola]|uniref:Tetratricopeptide repeat protein n=1 Tax=Paractinoplanes lichenicola TaxID=2802976 RepID=A0ABS1VZC2_9ACTN|nr:tetratricopeptide repeat protein [Actinoplanes lichenicola]MBL7259847.1 tetratricopeptide repeat protein [Actinoplanes lichenicola]